MEYDKPYEPINEHRPPETSAEKYFAYLNSEEGKEAFKQNFTGNVIEEIFKSKEKSVRNEKQQELEALIAEYKKIMYELTITLGVIDDLISTNTLNTNTNYALLNTHFRKVLNSPNNNSISSQRIIEKYKIAILCISSLIDEKKISDNTTIYQIIEILQKEVHKYDSLLRNLRTRPD